MRREDVGARLQDEIRIDARLGRRVDLLHHLLGGDDFLALHVTAALRPHLVLEHQAAHARALEGAHRMPYVDRVAVAGVGVGEERHPGARHQRARPGDIFLQPHDAHVGLSHAALRDPRSGDESDRIARLLDEPRAESVEDPRHHRDLGGVDHLAQAFAGAVHAWLLYLYLAFAFFTYELSTVDCRSILPAAITEGSNCLRTL